MNANPSLDPANNDSLLGLLKVAFEKMLQEFNSMLPCQVLGVTGRGGKMRVQVQILVMILTTNLEQLPRNQVASIPVYQYGGGGFVLSFPIKIGDLGWIKANDRDISIFLQSLSAAKPNTARKNNFGDGVFYPDVMRNFTLNPEDENNAVLQSLDGTVRLSIWPNQVKISAPKLLVDGDLEVTGTATIDGDLQANSDVAITGTTTTTGGISANGGMEIQGGGSNSIIVTGDIKTVGNITATGDITAHVPP